MPKFLLRPTSWTLALALASLAAWSYRGEIFGIRSSAERSPGHAQDILRVAQALKLDYRSETPEGLTGGKLIVSEHPLTPEYMQSLVLHDHYFSRWIGTVAFWRRGTFDVQSLYALNLNPEHPERYAQWGEFFVYGDPDLIREIQAAWQQQ
jgi:hypothetical protein